jgi:cell wall-associated NlpC family hydrolase
MIATWAERYIGLPFKANGRCREDGGLDCYGLVRLVLLEQFGIELPRYDGAHTGPDWPPVVEAVARGLAEWVTVPVTEARAGDGVVVRLRGMALHVGLLVDTTPLTMLHCFDGVATCCQRLDVPLWAPRLLGIYRWRG